MPSRSVFLLGTPGDTCTSAERRQGSPIDEFTERSRRRFDVLLSDDSGTDRHSLGSGVEYRVDRVEVDATDRERRKFDLTSNILDVIESDRGSMFLCLGRENRSDPDVVRTIFDGLLRLVETMGRYSDDRIGSENPAHFGGFQIVLPLMNSVGSGQLGDIEVIVDQERDAGFSAELAEVSGQRKELALRHVLFAQLNDVDAASDRRSGDLVEWTRGEVGGDERVESSVRQYVEPIGAKAGAGGLEPIDRIAKLLGVARQVGGDDTEDLLEGPTRLAGARDVRCHLSREVRVGRRRVLARRLQRWGSRVAFRVAEVNERHTGSFFYLVAERCESVSLALPRPCESRGLE